jgi:hypothetical protein
MHRIRGNLTYSNVISTLCLILLLGGGTAYAAKVMLPKGSVGAKQIRKGAVTAAKLSAAAKATLGGQGPKGAAGATGPAGPKGDTGERGEPGPFLEFLPSGKTETGVFAYSGFHKEGFQPTAAISYPFPLAQEPSPHIIQLGGSPSAACPGDAEEPQARPGNLCVYVSRNESPSVPELFSASAAEFSYRRGAVVFAGFPNGTNFVITGTWAVTAP